MLTNISWLGSQLLSFIDSIAGKDLKASITFQRRKLKHGRAIFSESHNCIIPESRLWNHGFFLPGLFPSISHASPWRRSTRVETDLGSTFLRTHTYPEQDLKQLSGQRWLQVLNGIFYFSVLSRLNSCGQWPYSIANLWKISDKKHSYVLGADNT